MTDRTTMMKECDKWPKQWMGLDEDVPYGQGIVEAMKPFVSALLAEDITDRTVRKHLDNLWILGGEIIRDVSMHDEYGKIAPADKLKEFISLDEGPVCRHVDSESARRSFDATCGKLCRFLESHGKVADKQIRRSVSHLRVHVR